ncbi:hypothetical protein diail_7747 [Diaporthe ilicicola]|nr:hypothetical protein diail_7747 [Diaporthe ilicicola]
MWINNLFAENRLMFRNLYRRIHHIVQRVKNMANKSTNQDAELSKYFVAEDQSRGVNAFEAATLDIPQTARPGNISPLARTLAELEPDSKGSSAGKFTPTPRPEPKGPSEARVEPKKVPRDEWKCCICGVTNPLAGLPCWQCKLHRVCHQCTSA